MNPPPLSPIPPPPFLSAVRISHVREEPDIWARGGKVGQREVKIN